MPLQVQAKQLSKVVKAETKKKLKKARAVARKLSEADLLGLLVEKGNQFSESGSFAGSLQKLFFEELRLEASLGALQKLFFRRVRPRVLQVQLLGFAGESKACRYGHALCKKRASQRSACLVVL